MYRDERNPRTRTNKTNQSAERTAAVGHFDFRLLPIRLTQIDNQKLEIKNVLGYRPLRRLGDLLLTYSWGCASLHPRPGSPAEHLGWGGSLYARVRSAHSSPAATGSSYSRFTIYYLRLSDSPASHRLFILFKVLLNRIQQTGFQCVNPELFRRDWLPLARYQHLRVDESIDGFLQAIRF